jgi:chromate transporter
MNGVELAVVFVRDSFLSFSGGALLALLEQDLVQRLHVLSPADFATGVAVGAASPGPVGYGCIALGFLAAGWPGALLATFASWLPAFLALPLRAVYRRLERQPWVGGLTWGVSAAGTGLLFALALGLTARGVTGWREAVIGAMALLLLFRRLPAPAVVALAAAAGALFLR